MAPTFPVWRKKTENLFLGPQIDKEEEEESEWNPKSDGRTSASASSYTKGGALVTGATNTRCASIMSACTARLHRVVACKHCAVHAEVTSASVMLPRASY
jgi:hypothetical protein